MDAKCVLCIVYFEMSMIDQDRTNDTTTSVTNEERERTRCTGGEDSVHRGGGIVLEGVATVSIERIYRVNWTSFILCSTKTHPPGTCIRLRKKLLPNLQMKSMLIKKCRNHFLKISLDFCSQMFQVFCPEIQQLNLNLLKIVVFSFLNFLLILLQVNQSKTQLL